MLALAAVPGGVAAARRGGSVLIAEDDAAVRDVILWALQDEGIAAVGVADGQAALDWLGGNRPAAVLLDIGLPLVDGVGVAEELRRVHGSDVPVVVMTAGLRAAASAQRIGARDFLAKPFHVEDLIAIVRRLLGT